MTYGVSIVLGWEGHQQTEVQHWNQRHERHAVTLGSSCCRTVKKDRVVLFKSARYSVPNVRLGRGYLGCPEHTASEAKL